MLGRNGQYSEPHFLQLCPLSWLLSAALAAPLLLLFTSAILCALVCRNVFSIAIRTAAGLSAAASSRSSQPPPLPSSGRSSSSRPPRLGSSRVLRQQRQARAASWSWSCSTAAAARRRRRQKGSPRLRRAMTGSAAAPGALLGLLGLQVCRYTAGCAPCEPAAECRQPSVHLQCSSWWRQVAAGASCRPV